MTADAVTHIMAFTDIPGTAVLSGAENHLFELMRAQSQRGLDVSLIMLVIVPGPRLKGYADSLRNSGIEVIEFDCRPWRLPRPLSGLLGFTWATVRLRQLLRRRVNQVIHTHLEHADVIGRVAAFAARCRSIVNTFHNNEPHFTSFSWRIILRMLARVTSHSIAISEVVRQHMIQGAGLPSSSITTIRYGVSERTDLLDKLECRQRFDIPADAYVVGFVGRLTYQKNIPLLIEGLASCPWATGVIIGGGTDLQALQALVSQKQLENIRFLGAVEDAAVLMPMFDVLCLPSRWEGLGLVLLEAMFASVPVIGSDAGAIPEILGGGDFGVLFQSGSVQDLIDKLTDVRNNPQDTRYLAARALAHVRTEHTVDAMVNATQQIYQLTHAGASSQSHGGAGP